MGRGDVAVDDHFPRAPSHYCLSVGPHRAANDAAGIHLREVVGQQLLGIGTQVEMYVFQMGVGDVAVSPEKV